MISFLIFYHDKDEHFLNDCLASLPKGEELVLIKTKQSSLPQDVMLPGKIEGRVRHYEYHYNELDFARMRNYGIKCCTQEWIFSIDPDERVLVNQHLGIMNLLHNIQPAVCAVKLNIISFCEHEPKEVLITPSYRLFRNRGIEYSFAVHEDIIPSLHESKGMAINSDLFLHHVGYLITKDEYKNKLKRNLDILNNNKLDEHPDKKIRERYKAYKDYSNNYLET